MGERRNGGRDREEPRRLRPEDRDGERDGSGGEQPHVAAREPVHDLQALRPGGGCEVFTFGTPAIKDGDRVEVRGVFQRVKQVGAYTFHDEIDASSVTPAK